MTGLLADVLAAFRLLTRVPLGRFVPPDPLADPMRGTWAFPVVGLAVNGLGGLAYGLLHSLGMAPLVAAIWSLAVTMIATGALHDDGLADTADGFGGGATPERKLAIMRDSRIGGYGALALLLSMLARAAALAALNDPLHVALWFCLAGMLGRGGILVVVLALRPTRPDGLGAAMGNADRGSALAGLVLAAVVCLLALPIGSAVVTVIAALGASLAVAKLAHGQIGGYTGDVLGAGEVFTECLVLSVAVCVSGG